MYRDKKTTRLVCVCDPHLRYLEQARGDRRQSLAESNRYRLALQFSFPIVGGHRMPLGHAGQHHVLAEGHATRVVLVDGYPRLVDALRFGHDDSARVAAHLYLA